MPIPPDARAAKVLEAVYALFAKESAWPQFDHLDRYLDLRGESDCEGVLIGLPGGLVYGVGPHSRPIRSDQEIALSVAGIASIEGGARDLAVFLAVIRHATSLEAGRAVGDPEPRLTPQEIVRHVDLPPDVEPTPLFARLGAILKLEPWGRTGGSWNPDWSYTFSKEVRRLRDINTVEDYWAIAHPEVLAPAEVAALQTEPKSWGQDVFVVHGRDIAARASVCRLILQATGREPIVLDEQPNKGRTVIEKFEDHAGDVGAAVVIFSPDDEGRLRDEPDSPLRPRARQNVIFELGWFYDHLGRDRVIALLVDNVEWPSDIQGVLYERVDPAGAWKHRLAKELASAGIVIDLSAIR